MRSLDPSSSSNNNKKKPPIPRSKFATPRSTATTASSFSQNRELPTFFQPRTPNPVPPRARPPLRPRDLNQNAPSLNTRLKPPTTTTAAATTTAYNTTASVARKTSIAAARSISSRTMPPGGGDNRARQPQLSAAAARVGHRPPLTPKVAATKQQQQQQPGVSPLGARRPGQQDAAATPPSASPFLANITPRTGMRQTRVESTNTTPNGTPDPNKNFEGWESTRPGLGVSNLSFEGSRLSLQSNPQQQQGDSRDSKFFHASDARQAPQGPAQQRPASVPQKPSTFFYANGTSTESKKATSPPANPSFTPTLVTTPEPTSTKFFYANGAPDQQARPGLTTSGSASTVSTSSRLANSRPGTGNSATGPIAPSLSRPMSPVKAASTPSVTSSLQGSALPPSNTSHPSITSHPSLAPAPNTNKRRVSIETPPSRGPPPLAARGHFRTGSVPSPERIIIPKSRSPQPLELSSPPLSPGLTRPAMTMASILQAAEDLKCDNDDKDDESLPEVHSPTKSVQSTDAVSELVANARRERKVQDLEITNASLEAINRTLERQLRKQTAELRRYRRLSRSGRFSLASGASSRVTSAAMTDPPVDLSDVSEDDQTEMDDQDSFHESDFSSDEMDSNDDPTSPNTRMAVRRKRDELRLQLDLTKHQELLIDSQKINQSIKRCLNWTKNLIKEGHKALEYSVRVSDVQLGGHVLAPPDEEEEDHSFQEPIYGEAAETHHLSTLEPPLGKPIQDRDSGIELPPDAG